MTLNSTDYSTSLGVAVFPGFSDPPNASTSYDAAAFEGTTFSVTSEFDVEVDTARQFTLALAVPLTGTPSGTAKVGFIFSILGYWT